LWKPCERISVVGEQPMGLAYLIIFIACGNKRISVVGEQNFNIM
jgi:hypothetical protein